MKPLFAKMKSDLTKHPPEYGEPDINSPPW